MLTPLKDPKDKIRRKAINKLGRWLHLDIFIRYSSSSTIRGWNFQSDHELIEKDIESAH